MKRITFALCALLFTFALQAAQVTTVILVRHAEKADASNDPPLTAEGLARAKELARVLRSSGITTIYTTNFKRTRTTAKPIALALHLDPIVNSTGPTYARDIANRIRNHHAGQTVLVVGHTNTTHDVMVSLGIANAPTIADDEFDNLFIVTLGAGSDPKLVALKYGN